MFVQPQGSIEMEDNEEEEKGDKDWKQSVVISKNYMKRWKKGVEQKLEEDSQEGETYERKEETKRSHFLGQSQIHLPTFSLISWKPEGREGCLKETTVQGGEELGEEVFSALKAVRRIPTRAGAKVLEEDPK